MTGEKPKVCIEGFNEGNGFYSFSIETVLIIYVLQYSEAEFEMNLKCLNAPPNNSLKLDISDIVMKSEGTQEFPEMSAYCAWPIIILSNRVVSGICAVARQIIKSGSEKFRHLLGFRESCLVACSETSIWTMFCEIDLPNSVEKIVSSETLLVPKEFSRFEYHLGQPVKIHNIYKLAGNVSREISKEQLDLPHIYAEGPNITLSDIILFPCVEILFEMLKNFDFQNKFPLMSKWHQTVQNSTQFKLKLSLPIVQNIADIRFEDSSKVGLYKSRNSQCRIDRKTYTKQSKVENSILTIQNSNIEIFNSSSLFGNEIEIDWKNIPLALNPCGGSLPESRAERKRHQLESMVKSVLKIQTLYSTPRIIVDFCSGSGHLGLIIAFLLPNCHIILVENKEKSLDRAVETIQKVGLKNVTIIQSNLDYFNAKFDLGVSLHACGTATDLVMRSCVENSADFVCCPCCYGGTKNCHIVTYPRSDEFKSSNISYEDYLSMAHCSDQTHELENIKTKQGYTCMDIIDTDRKLYAKMNGYQHVFLGKLQPTTCTNKNNLIVGIKKFCQDIQEAL